MGECVVALLLEDFVALLFVVLPVDFLAGELTAGFVAEGSVGFS